MNELLLEQWSNLKSKSKNLKNPKIWTPEVWNPKKYKQLNIEKNWKKHVMT